MLFNCNICHRKYEESELLQSSSDEYFCKDCFRKEYCANGTAGKSTAESSKCQGDSVSANKTQKMFSTEDLKRMRKEREMHSVLSNSKRPLQCPHLDCNKYVSIAEFNAHFQHEHMDVRSACTTLDTRNPLTFYPRDLRYGVKQCLVLLKVRPYSMDDNTPTNSNQEKLNPVCIAVIACRLAGAEVNELGFPSDYYVENEENTAETNDDKVLVWLASNFVTNYSYTVAVSTAREDLRVKYYGPLKQIGSGPRTMCLSGQCLILNKFHFMGMLATGENHLHLDVIIHSED